MLATDSNQGTSAPGLGRSLFSFRRDQMDSSHDHTDQEIELESFQKQVTQQFNELSSAGSGEILSISWVRNLLDAFIFCQEEFRLLLINHKSHLGKAPMDRVIGEFYDRNVKALDVCNAIRDGIEQIRQWQKSLEIVLFALEVNNSVSKHKSFGEGQIRRAKKSLVDLAIGMVDEKDSAIAHRNRSFGRNNVGSSGGRGGDHPKSLGHYRSLSWSVSRSWSASRQLQAMANNLNAPKANEISATNGLAVTVYTMSHVLLLVMWTLVAAIPCQDRGLQTHFSIPRQFPWAAPILAIHEKILDESKKRDRKNASGLLKEIYRTEKWTRQMNDLLDSVQFPLSDEKESEVKEKVKELGDVFEALKDGLEPLERQVREVFHRIIRSRTEGLDTSGD